MRGAALVDEAGFCQAVDGLRVDCCVLGDEGFEVARGWSRASAAWVEAARDDGVAEALVVVQRAAHLVFGGFACGLGFGGALNDELEPLVELVLHLLAVFEVLVRVLLEVALLLVGVLEVASVLAGPGLRKSRRDPDGTSDPVE